MNSKTKQTNDRHEIETAKKAAIEVLHHNAHGPYHGLPRTAGWGYPEPYTRDLLFSILGIAVSGDQDLLASIRKVLETLAKNQSKHGHMPSLVHDKEDRGSSDSTPLFLLGAGIFRIVSNEPDFLSGEVEKALTRMKSTRHRCVSMPLPKMLAKLPRREQKSSSRLR